MKVLLCLVSDQHVPNLLSVHHFQPDHVSLICSDQMRRQAEYFLDALKVSSFPTDQVNIVPVRDENNLDSVRRSLGQAFGRFPEAQWIANVTCGLKPMSIAAYEFFKALGARVVYIDSREPNRFLGFDGQPTEVCSHRLSLEEFIAGYGFHLSKSWDNIRKTEERARQWWPVARAIAANAAGQNLICVADGPDGRKEWNDMRSKGLSLEPRHTRHLRQEIRSSLVDVWGLQEVDSALVGAIDKYQAKFLTGEWLEAFCWKLLAEHAADLNLDHVHIGVEVRKKGTDAPTDFDVAFMSNQALGAIECKSGSQEHSDDPNQPLDKLEARLQQFRALRVNPILATTSSKILDEKGEVKPNFAQRAMIYNCRIVTVRHIQELASHDATAELVRNALLNGKRSLYGS